MVATAQQPHELQATSTVAEMALLSLASASQPAEYCSPIALTATC